MEEEKNIVDQVVLAEDVSNKIKYEFFDFILVKPLDPIRINKEFSKPVSIGETKDKNGVTATDFENVETEVKEVDSDYRRGIIIKIPTSWTESDGFATRFKVGDVVIFRETSGQRFDLLKDSRLLKVYEILGKEV